MLWPNCRGATGSLCHAIPLGTTRLPRWRTNPALRQQGADVGEPVAPGWLARQGCSAAPASLATQNGLYFSNRGAREEACRATKDGATSASQNWHYMRRTTQYNESIVVVNK